MNLRRLLMEAAVHAKRGMVAVPRIERGTRGL